MLTELLRRSVSDHRSVFELSLGSEFSASLSDFQNSWQKTVAFTRKMTVLKNPNFLGYRLLSKFIKRDFTNPPL
jgi:hypothetical protein